MKEFGIDSSSASEIGRLWLVIERSVKAIHDARKGIGIHRVVA